MNAANAAAITVNSSNGTSPINPASANATSLANTPSASNYRNLTTNSNGLSIPQPTEHDLFGDLEQAAEDVGNGVVQGAEDVANGAEAVANGVGQAVTGVVEGVAGPIFQGLGGTFTGTYNATSQSAGSTIPTVAQVAASGLKYTPTPLATGHSIAQQASKANFVKPKLAGTGPMNGGGPAFNNGSTSGTSGAAGGSGSSGSSMGSGSAGSGAAGSAISNVMNSLGSGGFGSGGFGGGYGDDEDGSYAANDGSDTAATPTAVAGAAAPSAAIPGPLFSNMSSATNASAVVPASASSPVADNNSTTAASTVDLVLEDVTLARPATVVAGPAYKVEVRNQGTTAAGRFAVTLEASLADSSQANAVRTSVEVPSLAAGETRTVIVRLPIAATRFAQLKITIDADQKVSDSDRSNNEAVVSRAALEAASK